MTQPVLKIRDLRAVLPALSQKDQTFALDVMTSVSRQGFATERQSAVLRRLYADAVAKAAPAVNLSPIVALIGTAKRAGLKRIALRVKGDGIELVVKPDDRRPGGLVVFKANQGGIAGTISAEGVPSMRFPEATAALSRFACDPVGESKLYGHETGACCYCGQDLTDPRSVAMGYGPICADRWNLPWGEKKAARVELPVTAVIAQAAPMTAADRLDEVLVAASVARANRSLGTGPKPWLAHRR